MPLTRSYFPLLFAFMALHSPSTLGTEIIDSDGKLRFVIETFKLKPIPTKELYVTDKYNLGRALFFDPILSGNRDVSCSTCHLVKFGTSDGLPLSIGVGGIGIGKDRTVGTSQEIHPRNSLDLLNRDHNDVKNMFWDGRIMVSNANRNTFSSPLNNELPKGLDNLMAVQSLFPLITPNEMLGYPNGSYSTKSQQDSEIENEFVDGVNVSRPLEHYANLVFRRVEERVFGRKHDVNQAQATYRDLYEKAYPETSSEPPTIVHIGNAIAHFIEIAFSTRGSKWDAYLAGKKDALTEEQKRGALIFYSNGRCAVCHSGETFSDYDFHSIGVSDTDARIASESRDLGRYEVTGKVADKFTFRTPPLRNVSNTSPYFHNGEESDLQGAINRHINPLGKVNVYHESGRFLMTLEQEKSVSELLKIGIKLTEEEIEDLTVFLESLAWTPTDEELSQIIPTDVPSKLNFHH